MQDIIVIGEAYPRRCACRSESAPRRRREDVVVLELGTRALLLDGVKSPDGAVAHGVPHGGAEVGDGVVDGPAQQHERRRIAALRCDGAETARLPMDGKTWSATCKAARARCALCHVSARLSTVSHTGA